MSTSRNSHPIRRLNLVGRITSWPRLSGVAVVPSASFSTPKGQPRATQWRDQERTKSLAKDYALGWTKAWWGILGVWIQVGSFYSRASGGRSPGGGTVGSPGLLGVPLLPWTGRNLHVEATPRQRRGDAERTSSGGPADGPIGVPRRGGILMA